MTQKPYETVKAHFGCPACGWTNIPSGMMCILGPDGHTEETWEDGKKTSVLFSHPRGRRIICSGCERIFYEHELDDIDKSNGDIDGDGIYIGSTEAADIDADNGPEKILFVNDWNCQYELEIETPENHDE